MSEMMNPVAASRYDTLIFAFVTAVVSPWALTVINHMQTIEITNFCRHAGGGGAVTAVENTLGCVFRNSRVFMYLEVE